MAMLREAHAARRQVCRLSRTRVDDILPALLDDRPEGDRPLFRARDAGAGNPAAVRSRPRARRRLLSRLCRADAGKGRAPPLQHLDPGRQRRRGSSAAIARSICRGIPSTCPTRRSSISKSAISRSATRASKSGAPSTRSSACASATTGAGRRRSASWGCRGSRSSRSATTRRPRTSTIPSRCICGCSTTS